MSKTCDKWTKVRIRPEILTRIKKLKERAHFPVQLTSMINMMLETELNRLEHRRWKLTHMTN